MTNINNYPKLVASDIGSTLIDGIQPLPIFTEKVLNRLVEKIPVALITGYNFKTTRTFTGNLDGRIVLMPQNGTLCIKENQLIWEYHIPAEECKQIASYLKEKNLPVVIYKGKNGDFRNFYVSPNEISYLSYGFERIPSINEFDNITGISTLIPDRWIKSAMIEIKGILGDKFKVVYTRGSKDSWLEICHREVRKDLALKRLCDELSIPTSEVFYFGDNFNDLEALRLVGHPVLVENAAPELKQEFQTVIQTVHAEGVAHYLNNLYQLQVF